MSETKDFYDVEFLSKKDLEWIGDAVENVIKKNPFVGKSRVCQILWSYMALKRTSTGKKLKVEYDIFDEARDVAHISIIGENINFTNGDVFKKVMGISSNFEVYPRTDNTVQMNITFYELADIDKR